MGRSQFHLLKFHLCQFYLLYLSVISTCLTLLSFLPALPFCHFYLPYLSVISTCFTLLPFLSALHSCHFYLPYLAVISTCLTFPLFLPALPCCHFYLAYLSFSHSFWHFSPTFPFCQSPVISIPAYLSVNSFVISVGRTFLSTLVLLPIHSPVHFFLSIPLSFLSAVPFCQLFFFFRSTHQYISFCQFLCHFCRPYLSVNSFSSSDPLTSTFLSVNSFVISVGRTFLSTLVLLPIHSPVHFFLSIPLSFLSAVPFCQLFFFFRSTHQYISFCQFLCHFCRPYLSVNSFSSSDPLTSTFLSVNSFVISVGRTFLSTLFLLPIHSPVHFFLSIPLSFLSAVPFCQLFFFFRSTHQYISQTPLPRFHVIETTLTINRSSSSSSSLSSSSSTPSSSSSPSSSSLSC